MHFVCVFGPPAVGKMTVGRAVADRSSYRLFHNHHTIELLLDVFDHGTPPFNRLNSEFRRRVVEEAATLDLFTAPRHPYTAGLLRSMPRVDVDLDRLVPIEGAVPPLSEMPRGCAFHPRCGRARDDCFDALPELAAMDNGQAVSHRAACFHALTGPP